MAFFAGNRNPTSRIAESKIGEKASRA